MRENPAASSNFSLSTFGEPGVVFGSVVHGLRNTWVIKLKWRLRQPKIVLHGASMRTRAETQKT